jgi:hypothetical protein
MSQIKVSSTSGLISHRALASSQSAPQILADAIGAYLPRWLLGSMIYLPTTAFKALRQARIHANRLGRQAIREKLDAVSKGLEMHRDVFSLFCWYSPLLRYCLLTEYMCSGGQVGERHDRGGNRRPDGNYPARRPGYHRACLSAARTTS